MTRQRAVEFSPVVAGKLPLLAKAIKLVAHLPTARAGQSAARSPMPIRRPEIPMVLQALEGESWSRGAKRRARDRSDRIFFASHDHQPRKRRNHRRGAVSRNGGKASAAVEEFARRKAISPSPPLRRCIERAATLHQGASRNSRRCRPPMRLRAAEEILEHRASAISASRRRRKQQPKRSTRVRPASFGGQYRRQLRAC